MMLGLKVRVWDAMFWDLQARCRECRICLGWGEVDRTSPPIIEEIVHLLV